MPSQKRMLTAPLLALVTLGLAGCETLTPSTKIDATPATQLFQPLHARKADTCETQRDIAVHNSVYDSLRQQKLITYKAPCDLPDLKSKKPPLRVS